MATSDKTTPATKTPRTPKPPVAVSAKVEDTLYKAVLAKKITKDEMVSLRDRLDKFIAFVSV